MTQLHVKSHDRHWRKLHPWPVRITHWVNALAMLILIGSGWKIYQDEVLFGWLHFPASITLGPQAQNALQWHFLGMWILIVNGVVYIAYGIATGRFRQKLFPISPRVLTADIRDALRFRLKHDDLTHYNMIQRLLYAGIILVGIVQVLSGLAIWQPVQFSELAALFGDFQTARLVHFVGMATIVAFIVVHVALAILVPRTLLAMLTGGPRLKEDKPSAPPPTPSEQAG